MVSPAVSMLSRLLILFYFPADGLSRITVEQVAAAMQVSDSNPMVGLEGRTSLLSNLASALRANPVFFGDDARPGNIIGQSTPTPPLPEIY